MINWGAFRDHIVLRRNQGSAEKTRNTSGLRSRRKSGDSASAAS